MANDDFTRRQMLAAMLASAAPAASSEVSNDDFTRRQTLGLPRATAAAAADDDEQPDEDALPVPTEGPYVPLVNQPPNTGYSPPRGPPPWADTSNMLASALAGGAVPSAMTGPAGTPPNQSAPSAPPSGAHYAKLPGPPLLLAGGEGGQARSDDPLAAIGRMLGIGGPTSTPASPSAQPSTSQPIAGQASDLAPQTPEQQEIFRARQQLRSQEQALTAQIAGTSNIELAKALAAQRLQLATHDQQLEQLYIGTLKQTRTLDDSELTKAEKEAGGEWQVDAAGNRSIVGGTESDTTRAPNEEETARLVAAGHDPKAFQVTDGKLEPISPERQVNTEIVKLSDGTFQTVDKQTGKTIGQPIGQPTSLEPTLTPQAIEELASRSIQGDNSALTSLGYGKIGAANRTAVANRVATMAQEQGVDATGIVRNIVGLGGEKAGARTMGQLGARINTFAEEAKQTGAMALQASDAMPREAWVPIEKIIQMGESAANNPKLSEFQAANNAFANTYSKAVNPTGVPTDEGRRAAFALLNVAKNPEAYRATVQQLQREMNIVQNAISTSRGSQLYGGHETPSVPGAPPALAPAAPKRHGVYVPGKGIQFQ